MKGSGVMPETQRAGGACRPARSQRGHRCRCLLPRLACISGSELCRGQLQTGAPVCEDFARPGCRGWPRIDQLRSWPPGSDLPRPSSVPSGRPGLGSHLRASTTVWGSRWTEYSPRFAQGGQVHRRLAARARGGDISRCYPRAIEARASGRRSRLVDKGAPTKFSNFVQPAIDITRSDP